MMAWRRMALQRIAGRGQDIAMQENRRSSSSKLLS